MVFDGGSRNTSSESDRLLLRLSSLSATIPKRPTRFALVAASQLALGDQITLLDCELRDQRSSLGHISIAKKNVGSLFRYRHCRSGHSGDLVGFWGRGDPKHCRDLSVSPASSYSFQGDSRDR
jgi:hypothetical protein